ncbi:hypothetical protein H9P43_003196 [Blastocladiella emersonii ATCC 22665]|nr:hypothetical protein H9P43_003196 [Blastocladiella emersonii ATCC 22665]
MMKTQYAYSSEPKPALESAQRQKKMYRSDESAGPSNGRPVNIMYDRRIYRGNTYASPILPAYAQPNALELQRQQQQRRKIKAARRAEAARRPRTPDAVEGRMHMEVQTELYLEELGDTVPEATVSTQTDAFLDRAPSPLYIPAKSGVDAATQILEGDLFDFDTEVEPLLEVLVGKTLDHARTEVLQEAELAALRRRQRDHAARRMAEVAEVQRLEQAEKRRTEEKERRKAEASRLLLDKQEAAKKVTVASFVSVYLSNLVPATLAALQDDSFFYNSREREIQQMFLPWLTNQVEARVARVGTARALLNSIIESAVKRRTYTTSATGAATAAGGTGEQQQQSQAESTNVPVTVIEADAEQPGSDSTEAKPSGGDEVTESAPQEPESTENSEPVEDAVPQQQVDGDAEPIVVAEPSADEVEVQQAQEADPAATAGEGEA